MRQHGLRPEAKTKLTAIGRFGQAMGFQGRRAALHLLKLKRPPTMIFAANLSAFGAIAAAHELGMRVPEDVSVIGFDDVPMASQVYPPLTTIRQPLQQMGRSAVNILLARIAGIESPSDRITLRRRSDPAQLDCAACGKTCSAALTSERLLINPGGCRGGRSPTHGKIDSPETTSR